MDKKIKKLKADLEKLQSLIFKQEKEIEELRIVADRDFLTGLYNRQGFINEIQRFLSSFEESTKKEKRKFHVSNISMIFIDLDNLKEINDFYGHKKGDKFLSEAAGAIIKSTRGIDVSGRWGGDEFVIGLIDANEKEAYKIANKIRKKISEIKIKSVPPKVKFSASIGIISAKGRNRKQINNLYELIEKADMAMYKAKKDKNKNFIAVFS